MALPIDCIVAVYYSGSVNIASTNSQSLVVNSPPILPPSTQQSFLSRISRHLDNVFRIPGLTEVISIYEILAGHLTRGAALTDAISISESPIKRFSKPNIPTESLSLEALVSNGTSGIGTGNYVQLNSIASFTTQLTIVAWVKFINADNRGFGGIISSINGYFGNRLLLDQDAQTILFETATIASGIVDCSYTMPGSVFSNAWHHFAAVYDGSQMQLYLDGAVVGTPVSQTGSLLSGSQKTCIGVGASGTYYLHGNVAELALYNSVLTAGQISNIYNNGANTVSSGQVSYYKFNEGSGHVIHDSTGTIDGQIINDQLWSTDVHSPLPNPSIYQGYFAPENITRKVVRKLAESALSISDSLLRTVRPFFIAGGVFVTDLLFAGKAALLSEIIHVTEGSGFTSGFTNGFVPPIVGLLRTVIPKITTEIISTVESPIRKVIPKILSQTITISDLVKGIRARVLLETIIILDSKLRKVLPKIATETASVSESQLRKPIPKITTQVMSISQQLFRIITPKITATVSISEALLRKAIPNIAAETITILGVLTKFKGLLITITQTIVISESKLRKAIPNVVTQTVTISENQLRKVIPKLTTQTATISELLTGAKGRFLTGTVTIGAESLTKIAKHFRTGSDSATISESLLRKPVPKIVTQTIIIVETSIKRGISRFLTATTTISESLLRKIPESITEGAIAVSEGIKTKALRPISSTITISESRLRKVIPTISTQTITITESKLRKVIPNISSAAVSILDFVSNLAGQVRALTGTVTISEKQIRKPLPKIATESRSISDSLARKPIPIITGVITIVESKIRKVIPKVSTETITISESKIRKVIPSIVAQTITISESYLRKISRKLVQTLTILESLSAGKGIFNSVSISQATTIVDSLLRKPIPKLVSQTISITESYLRKIFHRIAQTITVSDFLSGGGPVTQVSSVQTIIYTIYKTGVGGPSGGAGWGEEVHRPIPQGGFVVDYTMDYRKKWGGQY